MVATVMGCWLMSKIGAILRQYKAEALNSAAQLGLKITETDLPYFAVFVQKNRSRPIRCISKDSTVHLVYLSQTRFYIIYNNRYKVITQFLSEDAARINKFDPVIVWIDGKPVQGKVVFFVREYADPRKYLNLLKRYDTNEVARSTESNRPQVSYLVAIPGEGGREKVIWPPTNSIRKHETNGVGA